LGGCEIAIVIPKREEKIRLNIRIFIFLVAKPVYLLI